MSKKKKKNWDMFVYPPMIDDTPKEGDLRFYQRTVEKAVKKWWGTDYEDLGSSQKTLQRFDGKDWRDIPFYRDYIEI